MNVYTDLFFKSINVTYSHDFELDQKKIDIMMANISSLSLRTAKV